MKRHMHHVSARLEMPLIDYSTLYYHQIRENWAKTLQLIFFATNKSNFWHTEVMDGQQICKVSVLAERLDSTKTLLDENSCMSRCDATDGTVVCWVNVSLLLPLHAVLPAGRLLLHSNAGVWHQVDHAPVCPHTQTHWWVLALPPVWVQGWCFSHTTLSFLSVWVIITLVSL